MDFLTSQSHAMEGIASWKMIKKVVFKCDMTCPYCDELDGVRYCIHPFNEYMLITSDKIPEDCPL